MGVAATAYVLIDQVLRWRSRGQDGRRKPAHRGFVQSELKGLLEDTRPGAHLLAAPRRPSVYLIAGVNGSGKTTSIAKLAQHLKDEGKTILLAACDTFRAAAVTSALDLGCSHSSCEIVKGAPGADPALASPMTLASRALARNIDVLIVDTAGRLHTPDSPDARTRENPAT